jgi:hypothetical protein
MRYRWEFLRETQFRKDRGIAIGVITAVIGVLAFYDLVVAQLAEDPENWPRAQDILGWLPWYVWVLLGLLLLAVVLFEGGFRATRIRDKVIDELQTKSGKRTVPQLTIQIRETRFRRTFDSETKEPRTALYWEVLATLSPNTVMQIGDVELALSNGMKIKAQKIPTNALERTESHWFRFPLANTVHGVVRGHISVLAGGQMWHTDEFKLEVQGLNLSRIIRP